MEEAHLEQEKEGAEAYTIANERENQPCTVNPTPPSFKLRFPVLLSLLRRDFGTVRSQLRRQEPAPAWPRSVTLHFLDYSFPGTFRCKGEQRRSKYGSPGYVSPMMMLPAVLARLRGWPRGQDGANIVQRCTDKRLPCTCRQSGYPNDPERRPLRYPASCTVPSRARAVRIELVEQVRLGE